MIMLLARRIARRAAIAAVCCTIVIGFSADANAQADKPKKDPAEKLSLSELVKALQDSITAYPGNEKALADLAASIQRSFCNDQPTPGTPPDPEKKAKCLEIRVNSAFDTYVKSLGSTPADRKKKKGIIDGLIGKVQADADDGAALLFELFTARITTNEGKAQLSDDMRTELGRLLRNDPPAPEVINVLGAYYGDLNIIVEKIKRASLYDDQASPSSTGEAPGHDATRTPPRHRKLKRLVRRPGGSAISRRPIVAPPERPLVNPEEAYVITPRLELDSYRGVRYCSATQAVRAACQGKKNCYDDGALTITGTNLCGYEPVPYAEPAVKGLVISYQCAPKADWNIYGDGLLPKEYPDDPVQVQQPRTGENKRPPFTQNKNYPRHWALVRYGELTRIACSTPEQPPAADEKAPAGKKTGATQ